MPNLPATRYVRGTESASVPYLRASDTPSFGFVSHPAVMNAVADDLRNVGIGHINMRAPVASREAIHEARRK
jgi:hypothetical protein